MENTASDAYKQTSLLVATVETTTNKEINAHFHSRGSVTVMAHMRQRLRSFTGFIGIVGIFWDEENFSKLLFLQPQAAQLVASGGV